MILRRVLIAVVVLLTQLEVRGQTTNATCSSNSTTSWVFNEQSQSPCLVWSQIQSLCLPSDGFVNVPPLLDRTWGYDPPSGEGAMECNCNVVSYALMAGCTWCQLGPTAIWASEASWSSKCGSYNSDGLGFSEEVIIIPPYAWNQWNDAKWDPQIASQSATSYISYPTTTYSKTLSRSLPPPSSTPTAASLTTPNNTRSASRTSSTSNSKTISPTSPSTSATSTTQGAIIATPLSSSSALEISKWGPIVGGIVGGLTLLILLLLLILYTLRKRRNKRAYEETLLRNGGGDLDHPPFGGMKRSEHPRGGREGKYEDGYPTGGKNGFDRGTTFIYDPSTFAYPRTAPLPPEQNMKYTTTSQRQASNPHLLSDTDTEEDEYGPLPLLPGINPIKHTSMTTKNPTGGISTPSKEGIKAKDNRESFLSMTSSDGVQINLPPHPSKTKKKKKQKGKLRIRNQDPQPLLLDTQIQDFTKTPKSAWTPHYSASIISLSGFTDLARARRETLSQVQVQPQSRAQAQGQLQGQGQSFSRFGDDYRNESYIEPASPESKYPTSIRPESNFTIGAYGRSSSARESAAPSAFTTAGAGSGSGPDAGGGGGGGGGGGAGGQQDVGVALGSARDLRAEKVRQSRSFYEGKVLPSLPEGGDGHKRERVKPHKEGESRRVKKKKSRNKKKAEAAAAAEVKHDSIGDD